MVSEDMRKRFFRRSSSLACILALLIALSSISPALAVDYLRPRDFKEGKWSKTIDYLEYVDVHAALHGKPRPPPGAHAYLYMNYVNQSGVQMLYAGLSNITMGFGALSVTLPIQTLMLHYKTQDNNRDVVTASSYIMLMAYNESESTIRLGSPDRNDTLFASFSLGFDLSSLITTDAPALNSRTTTLPLTQPAENRWHWGMTYTNLTAIWWRLWVDPANATYQSVPVAISVYEELTFTYDMVLDLESNTTQITSNYVIGRMTDLWVVDTWWWVLPVIVHYNSTGCYRLNHSYYSDETIHQFLNRHGISMSMVFFEASVLLDHVTEGTVNGETVGDNEIAVSDSTIITRSDDGERICDTNFGSKSNYTLYNATSDSYTEHQALTRTAQRGGFAHNPIFAIHTFLMRYIPAVLVHIDPSLYDQAKNQLLNMTYADYFFIISYPTYDGYRIEHDPLHTAYFTPIVGSVPGLGGLLGLLFLLAIIACIVVVIVVVVRRRGSHRTAALPQPRPAPAASAT